MDEGPLARARQGIPDAAEALLSPVTLAALGLLVLNDHVLKAAWPGPVTGKLSDLAGLAFFPILLLSAWELILALTGRWRGPTVRALAIAVAVSMAGFIVAKTVPSAAEAAGWMLGIAQWLLALPIRVLAGLPLSPVARATVVADPTDLAALPALALAIWVGVSRLRADGLAAWPPASRPT
jgi:hypothetical protein